MIRGSLFSRFFLEEGICQTEPYQTLNLASVNDLNRVAGGCLARLGAMERPSEAETESECIFPILSQLGWGYLTQQEPGRGRRDIADALLFLNPASKDAASRVRGAERFRHGAVVVENEARDTRLDRASGEKETPSAQLLRYLARAQTQSDGAVRWGLLTTGWIWRLYWADAPARAEGFVEFDLDGLLGAMPPPVPHGAAPNHWLKVFVLLFSTRSLQVDGPGGQTFLDQALADGKRYQQRVTAALSQTVFDRVFPDLVSALAAHDPAALIANEAWLADVRETALRLLYRLLFLLYAEDRDLLPVRHAGYAEYSLRHLRDNAAMIVEQRRVVSPRASTWWPKLTFLFQAISVGDGALGLPAYNGGLFHDDAGSLMSRVVLPDAVLVPLLDAMSREEVEGKRRWINYRDLSVQHLGSIYEGLLERDPVADGAGGVTLRLNAFARKNSGSYYTDEELVRLILRQTLGPLLAERRERFVTMAGMLASDTGPKSERRARLSAIDIAEQFLMLRVCDPAMGSGHFLVSLVDYLADETLAAVVEASAAVTFGEYRSPLTERMAAIRAQIRAQATAHGWVVSESQLDDRHIVRRIILKRCVYGVDLNPMAVELAKLSLWLHSFTVGAPLSFLDHHLRCGDSLFGEFSGPVVRDLQARFGLVMAGAIVQARNAAAGMALVEEETDADIAGVNASAAGFAAVEQDTSGLRAFLDLYHAGRWLPVARRSIGAAGRDVLFGGNFGDPVAIAAGSALTPARAGADARISSRGFTATAMRDAAAAFVAEARSLAAGRRFLHWEAAFPGVWTDWEQQVPPGGFDAVIGNPPWDRMKMQEVEWFAARVPAIARATRAADRNAAVQALRAAGDRMAGSYDRARWTAETAVRVARECGAYPLLSGGDVNLYALMVERAARLVKPDGVVGLLVPSGIAADLGAAPFFRSLSTNGRLAALLDFENGRHKPAPFFPDVHRSFKFATLVFGGRARVFPAAACAFFQASAEAAERDAFPLTPADFRAVNPNTGTAPVFRTPRDAAITRGIYARLPVLIDRTGPTPVRVWPVRYMTMFHMTNDSHLFRTADELRRDGAYEVAGRRFKKGSQAWVPLFEGKMVQAYDHRAASIVTGGGNLHRLGPPLPATDQEHSDASWTARPQFWVSEASPEIPTGLPALCVLKDITSATNMRTAIASLVPLVPCGNTLATLAPILGVAVQEFAHALIFVVANLNATVLDFVVRTKVQALHLNAYILEQLPFIPELAYARAFGPRTARDIIQDDVLHLTYTAHDMASFARGMGYAGLPFVWDTEDRLRRRARIDAVFFHLYGLDRDDASYVMSTFPIVEAQEVATYGRYRSRDLVLATMAALDAGDPDAAVVG